MEIEKIECTKIKYGSEKSAIYEILKIQKKSKINKVPIRTYLCPYCLTWHLTSEEDIEVVQLRTKVKELNRIISEMNNKLLEKDKIINEMKKTIESNEAHIKNQRIQIARQNSKVYNAKHSI